MFGSPCRPGLWYIPRIISLQLSRISCCKGTRHPAMAVFTLEQMDLTETVCKHHKMNFCKLPQFSHLSPSAREVKVRLKKHRKLLCIPGGCDRAAWLLHGMPCGRLASPSISTRILCSVAPAVLFQPAACTLPGEAPRVLHVAVEKLIPVLRSPKRLLHEARAAPACEAAQVKSLGT